MNKHAVIAALTLMLSLPCHAYYVVGVGFVSCGKVVTDLRGTDQHLKDYLTAWFQGFISGRNSEMQARVGHEKSPLPDNDAIRVFVENYCGARPLEPSVNAADALWNSIQ